MKICFTRSLNQDSRMFNRLIACEVLRIKKKKANIESQMFYNGHENTEREAAYN